MPVRRSVLLLALLLGPSDNIGSVERRMERTMQVPLSTLTLMAFLMFAGSSLADSDSAIAEIRSEATVKDMLYQPDQVVKWQIGVLNDGSRRWGYASYLCEILREHEVVTKATKPGEQIIRVVDIVKVANGVGFRDASLGAVDCATYEKMFP